MSPTGNVVDIGDKILTRAIDRTSGGAFQMVASSNSLPRFSLAQLHYFSVCAEAMNMTRAAEMLHVSQSTVSASISNLESALGAQLFVRTRGKPLVLTHAGRQLLTHARALVSAANELATEGQESGAQLSGVLRVGVYSTLSPFYMPTLISHFQKAHPDVSLSFVEGDLSSLLAELQDGRCEVALVYGWDLPRSIQSVWLKECVPYAIVHSDHRLARAGRQQISLAELADEPIILLDMAGSGSYFQLLLQGVSHFAVGHQSSSYETVRSLVAAGLGFSILHQRPVGDRTYSGDHVYALKLTDALPTVSLSVAYRADAKLTRKAAAFVELCKNVVSDSAEDGGRLIV